MINTKDYPDRDKVEVAAGKTAWICRCWQSEKFPYCDGSHRKINADTGDKLGPIGVMAGKAEA